MATAGRILIMPKGNYDSSVTYEMLDLVGHNGKVWLAKKTVTGIEPSGSNVEYWFDMIDLTKVNLDDVGILSNVGDRQSTIKGENCFFARGRGRLYHPLSPHSASFIFQSNDSETETDKNSSAIIINRGNSLGKRYAFLEWDENGDVQTYYPYGTHNKPNASDIEGLKTFILQVIAENQ